MFQAILDLEKSEKPLDTGRKVSSANVKYFILQGNNLLSKIPKFTT